MLIYEERFKDTQSAKYVMTNIELFLKLIIYKHFKDFHVYHYFMPNDSNQ